MGRNFHSVCHSPCRVTLMHFRGKEGDFMQQFADAHYKHDVEILDDYVEEPPESYRDVFDEYHADDPVSDLVNKSLTSPRSPLIRLTNLNLLK